MPTFKKYVSEEYVTKLKFHNDVRKYHIPVLKKDSTKLLTFLKSNKYVLVQRYSTGPSYVTLVVQMADDIHTWEPLIKFLTKEKIELVG